MSGSLIWAPSTGKMSTNSGGIVSKRIPSTAYASDVFPARSVPSIVIEYMTPLTNVGGAEKSKSIKSPPFNKLPSKGLMWGVLGSFLSEATHRTDPNSKGSLILKDIFVWFMSEFAIGLRIVNTGGVTSNITFLIGSDVLLLLARSIPSIII